MLDRLCISDLQTVQAIPGKKTPGICTSRGTKEFRGDGCPAEGRDLTPANPAKVKAWRSKLYLISIHKDKEAGGARGGSEDQFVPSLNVIFQKNKWIYTAFFFVSTI